MGVCVSVCVDQGKYLLDVYTPPPPPTDSVPPEYLYSRKTYRIVESKEKDPSSLRGVGKHRRFRKVAQVESVSGKVGTG